MRSHQFEADARPKVKFINDEEDNELAYVMLRYRQVHDFWHVLCGLPPTILGEIALKSFEWRITGLPSCGLSTVIGPLRLTHAERYILLTQYIPWAMRSGTECEDLLLYDYEKHIDKDIDEIRIELNLEPAPELR